CVRHILSEGREVIIPAILPEENHSVGDKATRHAHEPHQYINTWVPQQGSYKLTLRPGTERRFSLFPLPRPALHRFEFAHQVVGEGRTNLLYLQLTQFTNAAVPTFQLVAEP